MVIEGCLWFIIATIQAYEGDFMNEYRVTVKNGSMMILSEIIVAEDEREVLGTLLITSELFNQPFTDIRILER